MSHEPNIAELGSGVQLHVQGLQHCDCAEKNGRRRHAFTVRILSELIHITVCVRVPSFVSSHLVSASIVTLPSACKQIQSQAIHNDSLRRPWEHIKACKSTATPL